MLALVGNPNVGKSVIFGRLTGRYVTVSNYPGTTVDVSRGTGWFGGSQSEVVDTPGILSLFPRSEDERVTRDLLLRERPHTVVQVSDAKNLRRSLLLTLELAELGLPMVLALNMSDEARARGIEVDAERLSKIIGIPVIETAAVTGEGMADLRRAISKACVPTLRTKYLSEVAESYGRVSSLFPENILRKGAAVPFAARNFAAQTVLQGDLSVWPTLNIVLGSSAEKLKARCLEEVKSISVKFARPVSLLAMESRQQTAREISAEVTEVTGAIQSTGRRNSDDGVCVHGPVT